MNIAMFNIKYLIRYGIFFEMDYNVALQINNKVELFYVKANECHRFISWIKHYLIFNVDLSLNNSIINQSHGFGTYIIYFNILQ